MKPTLTMAKSAYSLLSNLAPFRRWKLPSVSEVEFHISDIAHYGEHEYVGCHIIRISKHLKSINDVMETMAHEMIHITQQSARGVDRRDILGDGHGAEFRRRAKAVCDKLGFKRSEF